MNVSSVMPEVDAAPPLLTLDEIRRRTCDWIHHGGLADPLRHAAPGRPGIIDRVWGSSAALVAAAARIHRPGPMLIICTSSSAADDLHADLPLFLPHAAQTFPSLEGDQDADIPEEAYGERLRILKELAAEPAAPRVIVTSLQAVLQPVPSRASLRSQTRRFRVGDTLDRDELAEWLVNHGFHATSGVDMPGEFSQRGGIIDIFAPDALEPVRIELFGDQIDSLRAFDVQSQRRTADLQAVEVTTSRTPAATAETLLDYLPPSTTCLWFEMEQAFAEWKQAVARTDGDPTAAQQAEQPDWNRFANIYAYAVAPHPGEIYESLPVESIERFTGDLQRLRTELDEIAGTDEVIIICQTNAEALRLQDVFRETTLARQRRLQFCLGQLLAGFRWLPTGTVLVSASELFQRTNLQRRIRRHLGKAIDSFLDLQEDDLVVHAAHGIGRYRGLHLIEKHGQVAEHLEIEFHGGTRIFVPATKIEWVQKYIGGRHIRPQLARIGSSRWQQQKLRVQEAVADLAADMLELQARRSANPGISMKRDTEWQFEFDASFPYQETIDQLHAIEEIKADLYSTRPMDRLICGDVGFGKTELAMRAAFMAVDNGYQVAVLVPTTILAEQHEHTFISRMSEFPFRIAKLSRFCTAEEQRQIVKQLAAGEADIVIGTHRLASKDVQFQNLGLLIIDEEQRFGVEVKEHLKSLRSSVNVLTLSATPIPRTLHMSLTGMRDISNLESPPADRLPVETRVTHFQPELIRHAILRELNRGGQTFFVHNRVHDIHELARRLESIVPEARFGVGHGQMDEAELEQVMLDFVAHRFDVLLATTIIESGLDIPNANTIFIDEAENYGLADLHQLRGRVGRYKHRAHCYLLVGARGGLTPNAARRLRAIEEFSDMGAGFAIALRDLEIRGAGNLLGTQQSGHIATVGYEMYCQLLEAAVRRLRNQPVKIEFEVSIDLPVEAHLPRDYVADLRGKIDLYRRLARISDPEGLGELRKELLDRFGPLPTATERLFELIELKWDAAIWSVDRISCEPPFLVFHYTDERRMAQLQRRRKDLRVIEDQAKAYYPLAGQPSGIDLMGLAKSLLRPN